MSILYIFTTIPYVPPTPVVPDHTCPICGITIHKKKTLIVKSKFNKRLEKSESYECDNCKNNYSRSYADFALEKLGINWIKPERRPLKHKS